MSSGIKDKKNSSPDRKVCSNCSAPEGSASAPVLLACARCGLVNYCSKDCQRAHWKANHKQHCIATADRVPQNPYPSNVRKDATCSSVGASDKCAICQDLLVTDASVCTLPCDHVFHGECVIELRKFGITQACPVCRAVIPAGLGKMFDEATRRFVVIQKLVERGKASWSTLPEWAQKELDASMAGWRTAANKGNVNAQFNLG